VLSSRFGPDDGWKSYLRSDVQAQRALKSFPEAEKLATLAGTDARRKAS
jgi:hypothetical protein